MQFDKTIVKSLIDIPNQVSMIISSVVGCNLKCYKCHSWDHIVNHPNQPISEQEIIEKIKLNGVFFDNIILSGGEFMMNPLDDVIGFIIEIKKIFNGKIVIYTNGFKYNNIVKLENLKIVDDWYMDIKFPYQIDATHYDKLLYKSIVGVDYSETQAKNVIKSVEVLKDYNFRTVKYSIFNQRLYDGVCELVDIYKLKHQFNEFVEVCS